MLEDRRYFAGLSTIKRAARTDALEVRGYHPERYPEGISVYRSEYSYWLGVRLQNNLKRRVQKRTKGKKNV